MAMVVDTRADAENYNLSAAAMMEKQLQPPPGFRFEPADEELIGYYLRYKIYDPTFSCPVINEAPVYDSHPQKLIRNYGSNKWSPCGYFFSHQKRRNPNHRRPDRSAGGGVWKTSGRDEEVKLSKFDVIIGYRRSLVFYNGKPGPSTKTNWLMKEYAVKTESDKIPDNQDEPTNKSSKWVLCKIYELTRKRDRDEGEGEAKGEEEEEVILAEPLQQKRRLEEVKEQRDVPDSEEDEHDLIKLQEYMPRFEKVLTSDRDTLEEVKEQRNAPDSEEDEHDGIKLQEGMPRFEKVLTSDRDTPALGNPLLGKALGKPLLVKAKGKRSQRKRHQNKQGTAQVWSKETEQDIEDKNLKLNGSTVADDLGGSQSISSWLEIEEDGLEDHDLMGLDIPMDDLSEIDKHCPL